MNFNIKDNVKILLSTYSANNCTLISVIENLYSLYAFKQLEVNFDCCV